MATRYESADVKCPFYKDIDKKVLKIKCEGITDDCSLHLCFYNLDAETYHISLYCNERYRECPIYRMLMRDKYDEEV